MHLRQNEVACLLLYFLFYRAGIGSMLVEDVSIPNKLVGLGMLFLWISSALKAMHP